MKNETLLVDHARSILDSGGVVLITGHHGSGRTTLLRRIADATAQAGAIVNTITVDTTTSAETISALCTLRSEVLAIDDLDSTDPIPAFMTNDDGTAILATCHAHDASTAMSHLINRGRQQGVSARAATRLVYTHVDLVLVTGRRNPPPTSPASDPEFKIVSASIVDGTTLVPVYVTGPSGDRLTLPITESGGGR